MYRIVFDVYKEGSYVSRYKTCLESKYDILNSLCKWNNNIKYQYVLIDWNSINVSPLEEEIYPKIMEIQNAA